MTLVRIPFTPPRRGMTAPTHHHQARSAKIVWYRLMPTLDHGARSAVTYHVWLVELSSGIRLRVERTHELERSDDAVVRGHGTRSEKQEAIAFLANAGWPVGEAVQT